LIEQNGTKPLTELPERTHVATPDTRHERCIVQTRDVESKLLLPTAIIHQVLGHRSSRCADTPLVLPCSINDVWLFIQKDVRWLRGHRDSGIGTSSRGVKQKAYTE
jgi:hypothetical protein